MSKENLIELDNFRDEYGQSFRGLLNTVSKKHSNTFFEDCSKDFEYRRLVNFIYSFNKKSIDKTREETIREIEDGLPKEMEAFYTGNLMADVLENDEKKGFNKCLREIKQSLINLRKKK